MKIVCISDTHTYGPKMAYPIPPGDLLIHAGDHAFTGTKNEIFDAFKWLSSFPHRYKLAIAGNHDLMFENEPVRATGIAAQFPGITYLEDQAIEIEGVKFYGSPWQPYFQGNPNYRWVFNFPPQGENAALRCWAKIPDDTQVLITHGPPHGIMDSNVAHYDPRKTFGCPQLRKRIRSLKKLRLHVFGHIHGGFGRQEYNGVTFINAAVNTESYEPINPPQVFDLVEAAEGAA